MFGGWCPRRSLLFHAVWFQCVGSPGAEIAPNGQIFRRMGCWPALIKILVNFGHFAPGSRDEVDQMLLVSLGASWSCFKLSSERESDRRSLLAACLEHATRVMYDPRICFRVGGFPKFTKYRWQYFSQGRRTWRLSHLSFVYGQYCCAVLVVFSSKCNTPIVRVLYRSVEQQCIQWYRVYRPSKVQMLCKSRFYRS